MVEISAVRDCAISKAKGSDSNFDVLSFLMWIPRPTLTRSTQNEPFPSCMFLSGIWDRVTRGTSQEPTQGKQVRNVVTDGAPRGKNCVRTQVPGPFDIRHNLIHSP